jgi:serine/threonine protein kinase/tetratricopeptide (TPR) repeat protein
MKCPQCQHENPADTSFCGRCGAPLFPGPQDIRSSTKTMRIPLRELSIGSTFAGRYQVLEHLGKGGMGRVYKVLDLEINEVVALKVLGPELSDDEEFIRRFHNELKLARRISHKNVCGLYHLSRDESGTYYITMEFVPGEDLKSLMGRVGQLSIRKAVAIAEQVSAGLSEAHGLGIIHRDLKPQNIMIDHQGNVRIMDFGIALSLSAKGVTKTPMLIGTPEYMAPEIVDGKEADGRSDIYALGVILFEMLTGGLPFEADKPLAMAMKHRVQVPEPPKLINPQVPESLNRAVLRCLEKTREKRYQKVEELLADLTQIEKGLQPTRITKVKERKAEKIVPALRVRFSRLGIPFAAVAIVVAVWFLGKKLVHPGTAYDNYISVEFSAQGSSDIQRNLVEFLLIRSLTASTSWNIFIHQDVLTYKKQTDSKETPFRPAMLAVSADLYPKVTGFDVHLTMKLRNKTYRQLFNCKGQFDFLTERLNELQAFLASRSGGIIGPIEGNRRPSEIVTSSLDALDSFLRGEDAWSKLDSDTAFFEFRTALESDPGFSLAHIRMAEVLAFRFDQGGARTHLEQALTQEDRLIEVDRLRIQALLARFNAKPAEERQYLGKLIEQYPFKKEYHYEFAESYFHCGDAEEAITHYLKALELDSQYSLAHNHIAYCYSWIGDHARALEHFRKYQSLDNSANSFDSLASGYMFQGDCKQAISILEEGLKLSPKLDYLFGNAARYYIVMGSLKKAEEAVRRQADVATREFRRMDSQFWLAYIELMRGNRAGCLRLLSPVLEYYGQDSYRDRLDEDPNIPFWLGGVIAAGDGDEKRLHDVIARFERKIADNGVSSTNFVSIFKFYIHLMALEGWLRKDPNQVVKYIEEGKRIRVKMGYWGSFFNLPYFYCQYADLLFKISRPEEAEAILNDANSYNSQYASTYLGLAEVLSSKGDKENARAAHEKARLLLGEADNDCVSAALLDKLGRRLR